jgi:hypothetical protein
VGESEVLIVVPVQQTFEPGAKSTDELISTSYRAAPGTGFQLKRGSNSSGAVARSLTCGVVVDGHSHVNEATAEGTPRLPWASSGVTPQ